MVFEKLLTAKQIGVVMVTNNITVWNTEIPVEIDKLTVLRVERRPYDLFVTAEINGETVIKAIKEYPINTLTMIYLRMQKDIRDTLENNIVTQKLV